MSKLDRLRVTKYIGEKSDAPVKPEDQVVRVDYFADAKPVGFIELVRAPGEKDRPEYFARTEHTRWYATVLRSTAEQIDQDVKSVVAQ
jgi:hypothetical protein